MALLSLDLLGPPHVSLAGQPLDLRVRKELALLAYLAVEHGRAHSRDTLLALLWPDAPEEAARNNLRVVLAGLRRQLGDGRDALLQADRQSLRLLPTGLALDVSAFRALLVTVETHAHSSVEACERCVAHLTEAVELYRGDFLRGFSLPDSAPFEEWATLQRERLLQQQLASLETLAVAHEVRKDHAGQVAYGRRLLALEPWREAAHNLLIRGLWSAGERGAALEQYEACRRVLADELGLSPSPELTALFQQLRAATSAEPHGQGPETPGLQPTAQPAVLAPKRDHNLPPVSTSFVGREAELADVQAALARARLVTLTGAGGSGKTRLALQVARAALPAYADGVWLVELETLQDERLLPLAVATALEIPTTPGQAIGDLLASIQPKQLLLVLDTCEHLVPACQKLAAQLLRRCPQLTLLATSREMLRLAGELVVPVPPLAAPEATVTNPAALMDYAAVRLFVERARAVYAGFTLSARNAPALVQICRQLDGLPLALELAAARVRHLAVETIAARLDDRFSLLAGDSHAAPRQQRLHATIDWSYALLGEPERVAFRRLAVFAGSFTLQAAEEVVGEPAQNVTSTFDRLAQLIDKSLVVAEQRPEGMRYRLLETVRAYARDQLLAGEAEAVGARHLAYFLRLAEEAEAQLVGKEQLVWLERLAAEHANLQAAIGYARERGEGIAALRLVTALRYFWRVRGYFDEGLELLRDLLAQPEAAGGSLVRARALNAAGYLAFVRGQQAEAQELLEEALATGRAGADLRVAAFALRYLGALAHARQAYEDARALGEESLAIYRSLGATNDIAGSLMYLGDIVLAQGDDDRAEALYAESAAILRLEHNSIPLPYPLRHLGYLALRRGQADQGAALWAESVRLNLVVRDQQGVAAGLVGLATGAAASGQFEHAARLLGHAEGLLEALHTQLLPFDRRYHEQVRQLVGARLGEASFVATCATGRALTIEQLLATIPATEPVPLTATPPHNLPSPLSSFVGRAGELARLATLLTDDVRLVTLIGAGGVGKTRLALASAWQLLPQFAHGVWWVALAGVQPADEPALQRATLASAVATAFGCPLSGRRAPLDELVDALHDRAALLVLDNCEHLLEVSAVTRALLEAAPQLRVVATSREPLGLSGEVQLRLEGLPVPPPGIADPASYPGVQLFLERAARHVPGWGQGNDDGAVVRLCRLLDGLPLAIELAANWVGHFTPDEIAEAIQADLDFLAARTRDLPDRHRSLRAVFDYAWHALNAAEQQALIRLTVFRGSFDRAAVQAVTNVRTATLVALVDKSLVQQAGIGRYSLHELLRQFAAERLEMSGDAAALRAQHAAYYLALAEQAAPELTRPDQANALERLDRALNNLRAVLGWAWEQGQTELGLRLAGALERFWFTRGYLSEGREWLERFLMLAAALEASPAVRAQAFSAAGLLANTQGDHLQATHLLEQGLACYQAADDLAGAVRALTTLGGVAYDQGDLHGALERWEQSLAQARAVGDLGEVVRALGNLGEAHFHLGDLAHAEALHTEALALARQLGRTNLEAFQLGDLGNVARRQGNLERARALHRQALELKRGLGARRQIAISLEDLACVAAAAGDGIRAARLLGAAATIREEIGTPQATPERLATEQAVREARAALGEDMWASAFKEGLAYPLNQAISHALE